MKGVWTKVGVAALAGIVIANAFIPYAFATDGVNSVGAESLISGNADSYFTVENSILDFGRVTELERSYTKAITIKNNTASDVIIDASLATYTDVAADNQKLAEWAAFVGGITHFSIAAGSSRDVSVRVAVPADAIAGTQYANIELVDANSHKETVLAKIDIAGDNLKYGSEVTGADIDPIRFDEIVSGHATVKNNGTAGFTSSYQIRTKNFFGGVDWNVVKEDSKEVFPGKQAEFKAEGKVGFGVYFVEQRVTFANAEGRMTESLITRVVINLPWWSLAIAGGVILLIIIIIIIAKRRKGGKKKADKLAKAERKAHAAEVERVEQAEEDMIADEAETAEEEEEIVSELSEEEPAPEVEKGNNPGPTRIKIQ